MNWAYMLRCNDGTLYSGWTNCLEKRVETHNNGKASKYTRGRLPVKLAFAKNFETKSEAMQMEAKLKKLTKKQKEILVATFNRKAKEVNFCTKKM